MTAADRIAKAAALPTPEGIPSRYTPVGLVEFIVCTDCGVLVYDQEAHNNFHASIIERPF